jgi:Virulence protein
MEKFGQKSQVVIYKTETGETKIDVRFDGETVWLTIEQMAELFGKAKSTINEHILNIYKEGELEEGLTINKIGISGFTLKPTNFYNLDVIISVGYRVKSSQGMRFRQWATKRLGEYIVKGFVLDDERLKNPDLPFDYFEELTRRIADIRTSEKRFYKKITDIYATSVDYDPTDEQSILFFKTVQNKVHYAITGQTAPEIISARARSAAPNMGLTSWRGAKPRKDDITIAKNYLSEPELTALNNLVEQYLVFAEGQAKRRIPMHMKDWIEKLHGFLKLNDRDILQDAGKVSHEIAIKIAEKNFLEYTNKNIQTSKDVFETLIAPVAEIAKNKPSKIS